MDRMASVTFVSPRRMEAPAAGRPALPASALGFNVRSEVAGGCFPIAREPLDTPDAAHVPPHIELSPDTVIELDPLLLPVVGQQAVRGHLRGGDRAVVGAPPLQPLELGSRHIAVPILHGQIACRQLVVRRGRREQHLIESRRAIAPPVASRPDVRVAAAGEACHAAVMEDQLEERHRVAHRRNGLLVVGIPKALSAPVREEEEEVGIGNAPEPSYLRRRHDAARASPTWPRSSDRSPACE